ncbi:MAG: tetrahydrofolate dehydrogenase/cyclohydrolase catalytic domain-containing protein, partial [candidate division WOR-3 bacterium]
GKALADRIQAWVGSEAARLRERGCQVRLQVALVGNHPPSQIYVRNKENACAKVGIQTETARLGSDTSEQQLLELIRAWNADPAVHGILVQLPLPEQFDEQAVVAAIEPRKDVDGLHPFNLGRILTGTPYFFPATPSGILELLRAHGIITAGKHVVILGRGALVGKPLANMLLRKPVVPDQPLMGQDFEQLAVQEMGDATVTVCHTRTQGLELVTRQADILVAAAGQPGLVKRNMVRPGAVVVDAGVNRVAVGERTKILGDVDFAEVAPLTSAITPVPGGVGPMTVAMLLVNTVRAARKQAT